MAYNNPWETDLYKQVSQAFNPYPKRVIDETTKNDILEEQNGQFILIGHTLKYVSELESTLKEATEIAEKYYNMLVENGLITPKKTTEELLSEQCQINAQLLAAINNLQVEINDLKNTDKSSYPINKAKKAVKANGIDRPSDNFNQTSVAESGGAVTE